MPTLALIFSLIAEAEGFHLPASRISFLILSKYIENYLENKIIVNEI